MWLTDSWRIINYVPRRRTANEGFVSSFCHETLLPGFLCKKYPFLQYYGLYIVHLCFHIIIFQKYHYWMKQYHKIKNHVIRVCLSDRKDRSLLSWIQIRHLHVLNQNWVILQSFQAIIYDTFCTIKWYFNYFFRLHDGSNLKACTEHTLEFPILRMKFII